MNEIQFTDREWITALMIFSSTLLSALDDMNRKRFEDNLDRHISLMEKVNISSIFSDGIEKDRLRHLLKIFLEMSKSQPLLRQTQSDK